MHGIFPIPGALLTLFPCRDQSGLGMQSISTGPALPQARARWAAGRAAEVRSAFMCLHSAPTAFWLAAFRSAVFAALDFSVRADISKSLIDES